MVRSPGFEPGSSAWQADVLAKLDYNRFLLCYAPVALLIVFEVYFFFPRVLGFCCGCCCLDTVTYCYFPDVVT
jgi:hypothetical protein